MPVPPILCTRFRNGSPRVGRLLGGTEFVPVGNTFGAESVLSAQQSNFVVQFGDGLYVHHEDKIRKYNSGTEDWDVVHTIANQNTTANYAFHGGIHVAQVDGVPRLISFVLRTNSAPFVVWSEDGSSWNTGIDGPVFAASSFQTRQITGNRFMAWQDSTGRIRIYDPASDSWSAVDNTVIANGAMSTADVCVWDNRIFMLSLIAASANGATVLFELVGGLWTSRVNLDTEFSLKNGSNNEFGARFCLFVDGADMYGLLTAGEPTSGLQGTNCIRFQDGGGGAVSSSLITSTVIPAAMRGAAGGPGEPGSEGQWWAFVDNETDPATPAVHLWFLSHPDDGTVYYFTWNGNAAEISPGTIGPAHGVSLTDTRFGGSDRIWSATDLSVQIVDRTALAGQIRLHFRSYGDSGPSDKTVSFRFSTDGRAPSQVCTLAGTATGGSASRSGDTVTLVNADDGTTLYTVDWDASSDGVIIGDSLLISPFIE